MVDVGKRADLVLLEADRPVDIRNIRRISAVLVRGTLIKPAIDATGAKHGVRTHDWSYEQRLPIGRSPEWQAIRVEKSRF